MCRMMNLTIINEENLCPLLHTSAPVTSLDRHTGYEQFTEEDVTNEPIRHESHLPPP